MHMKLRDRKLKEMRRNMEDEKKRKMAECECLHLNMSMSEIK